MSDYFWFLKTNFIFFFSESPKVQEDTPGSAQPSSPLWNSSLANGSHIEAKVVVQSERPTQVSVAPAQINSQSASSSPDHVTPSPTNEIADVIDSESDRESSPVPVVNLKHQIQAMLSDFSGPNDQLLNRHQLYVNTRVKLLQGVENWLCASEKESPKVLLITGPAGIGKTCVASEICRRHASQLAGYHFFDRCTANIGHNNLKSVILSLANHFCDVFPQYTSTLPGRDKIESLIARGDINDIYDNFIFKPLTDPELKHLDNEPKLIVLDAIDQCDHAHRDTLLEILQKLSDNSPQWLRVLVTSRNENQILAGLDKAQIMEMKKNNDNMVDIKRFLKEPLGKFMDRISLDGGLTQLAKKCEGLFVTASVLEKQLNTFPPGKKIAMREVDHMFPSGLSQNCTDIFTKYRENLSNMAAIQSHKNSYETIVSILLNIREPIHKEFAVDALDLPSGTSVDSLLSGISSVLYEEEGRVKLCSRAVVDWLLDQNQSKSCCVDVEVGQEKLASLSMKWLGDLIDEDRR